MDSNACLKGVTMLSLKKTADETWLDALLRYARPYGMEGPAVTSYARMRDRGIDQETAAFEAAYEWDILDLILEEEPEGEPF